jgi:hypothetical protein
VNPRQIGLIGHSEGGLIAPMAAVQSRDVAFIVMMAGPGVTGEEILYEQGAKIARAAGATEAAVQKGVAAQRQIFSVIKQEDGAQLVERVRAVMHAQLDSLSAEERAAMGAGGDVNTIIEAQVKQVTAPWFRWFLTYDPRTSLEHVTVPVLAINGELDLQVPPEQSLPVIEAALKQAANKDFTVRRLPRLNHLFQTATTGAPSEYDKIEETLSPAALDLMSGWILARFGKPVPRS